MTSSYRAQTNLQLMLADKFLSLADAPVDGDDWGGHRATALIETAVFRLNLAYCCHLADLLESRNLPSRNCASAVEAKNLVPGDMVIPELDELADREDFEPWLNLLLQYRYIDQPGGGARMAQGGLLAVDAPATMAPDAKAVREAQRALLELVQRHRDTLQEY